MGNCIFALVDQQGIEAVLQCYDSKGHKSCYSTTPLEETMTRLCSLMHCAPSIRSQLWKYAPYEFCVSGRTLGGLVIGTDAALLPFPQLVIVTKPPQLWHQNKSNENVTLGCRCVVCPPSNHFNIDSGFMQIGHVTRNEVAGKADKEKGIQLAPPSG